MTAVMQRHWVPQLNPRADPYCSATGRGTETVRNQRPPSPRLKVRPGFPPGLPEFPAHPNHDLVSLHDVRHCCSVNPAFARWCRMPARLRPP